MRALIKHLYKDNALTFAIVITISITYLSLSKVSSIIPVLEIKNGDKYQHLLAYFGMMMSWLFVSQKLNTKRISRLWAVMGVFLFGVLMEVLQQRLTTYRQADLYDVFANLSGIIIAYIVFEKLVFKEFKDFLCTP
jgi:VanZ family protein